MLKKLVKYGNSNALILDRAILELLNISEGAIVKLHTDGKSLVITPHDPAQAKDLSMEGMEMLQHSVESEVKRQTESIKIDPVKSQQMDQWMPGTENGAKLAEAIKPIMEKYRDDMALLQSEPFLRDVEVLAEKYQGDRSSPEFFKEFLVIRLKHAPSLANFDKEMLEVSKALGMPGYL